MLQNARVTAFTISELLRENQQGRGGEGNFRLGLNKSNVSISLQVKKIS